MQEYNGPREANGIIKYMKSQVGPASVELKDKAGLDKIREKNEVVVVSFHTDKAKDEAFQKVICLSNSARSQMEETFLKLNIHRLSLSRIPACA